MGSGCQWCMVSKQEWRPATLLSCFSISEVLRMMPHYPEPRRDLCMRLRTRSRKRKRCSDRCRYSAQSVVPASADCIGFDRREWLCSIAVPLRTEWRMSSAECSVTASCWGMRLCIGQWLRRRCSPSRMCRRKGSGHGPAAANTWGRHWCTPTMDDPRAR